MKIFFKCVKMGKSLKSSPSDEHQRKKILSLALDQLLTIQDKISDESSKIPLASHSGELINSVITKLTMQFVFEIKDFSDFSDHIKKFLFKLFMRGRFPEDILTTENSVRFLEEEIYGLWEVEEIMEAEMKSHFKFDDIDDIFNWKGMVRAAFANPYQEIMLPYLKERFGEGLQLNPENHDAESLIAEISDR